MDSIIEIKKRHVSAYHWPSSGFILEVMLQECYTVIAKFLIYYPLETSSCVIDGNHPTYHQLSAQRGWQTVKKKKCYLESMSRGISNMK